MALFKAFRQLLVQTGLAKYLRAPYHNFFLRRHDRGENKRWFAKADHRPFILLIRHSQNKPHFYQGLLHWLEVNFPDLRSHFLLDQMASRPLDTSRPALVVPWLQDPIEGWSTDAFEEAKAFAATAHRLGIPIINTPRNLSNISKSRTSTILSELGVRTPRMKRIAGKAELAEVRDSFPRPFFIRNDLIHGGPVLAIQPGDFLEDDCLSAFTTPVAIEWIDTRSSDGLFRKYRYQAAGKHGISVHLLCSPDWEVRGHNKLVTPAALAEEQRHIAQPDSHHALFQKCRQAMGLDFIAFDYAYDVAGQLVVWEANGYPSVYFGPDLPELKFRRMPVHRIFAAMTGLYFDRAGLPLAPEIDQLRNYSPGSENLISFLKTPA